MHGHFLGTPFWALIFGAIVLVPDFDGVLNETILETIFSPSDAEGDDLVTIGF